MAKGVDRRAFLRISGASLSAAALPVGATESRVCETLILLWIPGGMAATETFDPKEHTPYRAGLETRRMLSSAPSIETAVRGIRIARGLENIAGVLDRGTLIRSFVPGDLGALAHARYQQRWQELAAEAGELQTVRATDFSSGCAEALELASREERGTRTVLVPFEAKPFEAWDTHDFGAARMAALKKSMDAPVATLVLELERRGLLKRTRVVLASEFSRAPDVERGAFIRDDKDYGLHAHFGGSASVLLFGGPIEHERVIGRTADVHPAVVVENPIGFDALRDILLLKPGRDSGSVAT